MEVYTNIMNTINETELVIIDDKKGAFTTSIIISEYFNKKHKNVIRDIETLDCSKEFWRLNFEPSNYKDDRGKIQKLYRIKKDGLVFLIMGYRGQKASELKEKYISRFNLMENILQEMKTPEWEQLRLTAKSSTKTLHETINDKFLPYAIASGSKTYKKNPKLAYTHFDKPINKALGLKDMERQFLSKKGQTILDVINNAIIITIEELVLKGINYHDIISTSKTKINQISDIFNFSA